MDRGKWAPSEKLRNVVFGFDVLGKTITVFASMAEAVGSVEGLAVAEGDWRFFSADGAPMEAHFSIPAQIHSDRNTYSNGKYTLEPAAGPSLYELLSIVACEDRAQSGLQTLRDIEQFLIDRMLGES